MAKVFWGVLLALLAFSAITATLFFMGVIGFSSAVHQAVEENGRHVQADMEARQRALAYQQRMAAFRRAEDLRRRELAADERCVGGTVIQVRGTVYTQLLGANGRPQPCSGRYRLQ
jgi:hypothetical protein